MSDLKAAIPELRRPFTPQAVQLKIQTNPKQRQDGSWGKALIVTFMDSRMCAERLNSVVPGEWSDEYEPMFATGGGAAGVVCRLTVCGATRSDVGFEQDIATDMGLKGLYSDAFKRAAVKFGIGAYLYALPKMYVDKADLNQRGKSWYLSDQAERKLRQQYAQHIARAEFIDRFGTPVDHGDAEDSQAQAVDAAPEPAVPQAVTDELIAEAKQAVDAGVELGPLLDGMGVKRRNTFPQTVRGMGPDEVERFRSLIAEAKEKLGAEEVKAA